MNPQRAHNTTSPSRQWWNRLLRWLAAHHILPLSSKRAPLSPPLSRDAKEILKALDEAVGGGDILAREVRSHLAAVLPTTTQQRPLLAYSLTSAGKHASHLTVFIAGAHHPFFEAYALYLAYELVTVMGGNASRTSPVVVLNTLGNEESVRAFLKSVHEALRRNIGALSPALQAKVRATGPTGIWLVSRRQRTALASFPRPLATLTPPSRANFQEVLEIAEEAAISYEIDDLFLLHPLLYSHAIFRIENGTTMRGVGGSLSRLAAALTGDPTAGLVAFTLTLPPLPATLPSVAPPPPQFLFTPLAHEGRLRALPLLRTFLRARLPVRYLPSCGGFCDLVATAERQRIPYLIVLGVQEARTGRVLIRRLRDRSQREVPFEQAAEFLRAIETLWHNR